MDLNKFQLRNYHIRRGRPKDSTPIYPVTKAEYIIGDVGGVTKVASLPETGESGKIYYNTTDGKYYIYGSNGEFSELNDNSIQVITSLAKAQCHTSNSSIISFVTCYILEPNILYTADVFADETALNNVVTYSIALRSDLDDTTAENYTFRITLSTGTSWSINLKYVDESDTILNKAIIVPDIAQDVIAGFEQNHTYEFNIFDNVLLVTDITETT